MLAWRLQQQNLILDTGDILLPLLNDKWLKAPLPVTRNGEGDIANVTVLVRELCVENWRSVVELLLIERGARLALLEMACESGDALQLEAAWGVVVEAPGTQSARPLVRVSGAGAAGSLVQARVLGRDVALQLCAAGAVRTLA